MDSKLGAALSAAVVVLFSLFSALELFGLMGKNPVEDPYHVEHYTARIGAVKPPSGTTRTGFITQEQGQSRNLLLFLSRYALAPILVVDSPDVFPRVRGARDGVTLETKTAQ
ncbi:hypothetical protein F183_A14170 [Bryobacterales bacterium F-183]|nr:hypothetical protein F183_A14170 [Bryobacterales bacterium F-183]